MAYTQLVLDGPYGPIRGSVFPIDTEEFLGQLQQLQERVETLERRLDDLEKDKKNWDSWWNYWKSTFAGLEDLLGHKLREIAGRVNVSRSTASNDGDHSEPTASHDVVADAGRAADSQMNDGN